MTSEQGARSHDWELPTCPFALWSLRQPEMVGSSVFILTTLLVVVQWYWSPPLPLRMGPVTNAVDSQGQSPGGSLTGQVHWSSFGLIGEVLDFLTSQVPRSAKSSTTHYQSKAILASWNGGGNPRGTHPREVEDPLVRLWKFAFPLLNWEGG